MPPQISCLLCGSSEPSQEFAGLKCQACGGPLEFSTPHLRGKIALDDFASRPDGVWKFLELLPIRDVNSIVSLGEGGTHLHRCDRLGARLGLQDLWIKDETTNPTGAFEDRGTTVEISHAKEAGHRSVACATTGNLGASVAAYAAKAGMGCRVYVPSAIDLGKLYQIIAFGAEIEAVHNYDAAQKRLHADRSGWFAIQQGSPYFLAGLKTAAYEMVEQLGWSAPERIVVPMGNGSLISMMYRGLVQFSDMGLTSTPKTKMTGVQVTGTDPIVRAISGSRPLVGLEDFPASSLDIGVSAPIHGELARKIIIESAGTAASVTDREIIKGAETLARTEGIFAEPAAASTVAGLTKLVESGRVERDEKIVCLITGSGLKDPALVRSQLAAKKGTRRLVQRAQQRENVAKLGVTKIRLLEILDEDQAYGYELWRTLASKYGISVKLPSIYQHLSEMEASGLVRRGRSVSHGGRPERAYYSLSQRGRLALKARTMLR